MTIGIGMICREGVLLCADSEVSGWPSKTQEEKIDIFDCPYGKFGFVMAGNATLAQSAIEKCRESLTLASPEKAIRRLERILDREYRRQVFQHPNWASDPNLAYWFLVAAWSAEGKIQLYSTQETVLKKVNGFHCIGIGADLASYLLRSMCLPGISDAEALCACAFALSRVKQSITSCGGMSIFRNIRARDGNVGLLTSYHDGSSSKEIDRYALAFEAIVHRLLFWMADMGMEEEHFMLNLTQNFNADILRVRDRWRAEFDERLKDLTSRNPSHTPEMLRRIAISMWTRGTPE